MDNNEWCNTRAMKCIHLITNVTKCLGSGSSLVLLLSASYSSGGKIQSNSVEEKGEGEKECVLYGWVSLGWQVSAKCV